VVSDDTRACRQLSLWGIFDGFSNKIFIHVLGIVEKLDQRHVREAFGKAAKSPSRVD
jgi:hypothetical protein